MFQCAEQKQPCVNITSVLDSSNGILTAADVGYGAAYCLRVVVVIALLGGVPQGLIFGPIFFPIHTCLFEGYSLITKSWLVPGTS